jgi:hypothetical protein
MKKLLSLLSKSNRIPVIILTLIMLGAFAVRTFQFHDWLYFKWDQARDGLVISNAVLNGPGELPLLGPRATKVGNGEFLRLGPAYFYMQYLSGIIFNSTSPETYAYPDLLFSLLSIPLLFLFLKLFFSQKHALILTALYSFCFLIIQYSRFSWNPNAVPFFALLSFYSLIKFFQPEETTKQRIAWIAIWAFSLAIASQLHFFAFFSLAGINGLFFLYKLQPWHKANLTANLKSIFSKNTAKFLLIVTFIISFLYIPMFISESMTQGENSRNFIKAFSYKPKDKPFIQKLVRDAREQTKNYFLIVTAVVPKNKNAETAIILGAFLIVSGLALAIREYRQAKTLQSKDFAALVIIWTVIFYIVCISMAYQLRPRFFVVVFAVPFIFVGFWFRFIEEKIKKNAFFVTSCIALMIFLFNAYGTYAWFREQHLSQNKAIDVNRTLILKKKDGITLRQFERAVDYIYAKQTPGKRLSIYTKTEYSLPIKYLFTMKHNPNLAFDFILNPEDIKPSDNFYALVTVSGGPDSINKEIRNYLTIKKSTQFGQILVIEGLLQNIPASVPPMTANNPNEITDQPEDDTEDSIDDEAPNAADIQNAGEKDDRLYWKDVF